MGRLRKKPWAEDYLNESKITFTEPELLKGKWRKEFGNDNPIWLEIGMGKGGFTLSQSDANKDKNILGIEKFPSVQVMPVKKVEEDPRENLKFISGDATAITDWFEEESIDKIFINFPDPWPKASHAKRRLLFHTFLNDYFKILKKGSWIEFKTDQLPLFEFALEQVNEKTKFTIKNETRNLHADNPNVIKTEYETRFSNMGNPIYYVELHKD